MDLSTVESLSALNRAFYQAHADDFADSRPRLAPGVGRVLALIDPGARVLELGCGDGKVARRLAGAAAYVGVDWSAEMLEAASQRGAGGLQAPAISFHQADLADPAWTAAVPPGPYDWLLAFGVFHHLPGRDVRQRVLAQSVGLLAPGGRAAMSNWQFTRSQRLMQRVRPWAEAGIDPAALEPGDYLLAWERKGRRGLRYVHVLDQAEARALAEAAGLRVTDVFQSDGVTGDLSEYVLMAAD
jgi:tRNA (uracil-5-)-methyltransferase TRM9